MDFRLPPGQNLDWKRFPPTSEARLPELESTAAELARYQDCFLAHEDSALLLIFQGMDGAHKDATIKHVLSWVDPQGCKVANFGAPEGEDLKHVYLRRYVIALPDAGKIGVFNRSYYEQVVTDRVHREKCERWQLKGEVSWERRYRQIRDFEKYLSENDVHILKFFLHMSYEKQGERLLERISRKDKQWKFSSSDLEDRELWDEHMEAWREALTATSTEWAPWHVIPDDDSELAERAVATLIRDRLRDIHPDYPELDERQKQELEKARSLLAAGDGYKKTSKS